jgi:hypothetical protein
MRAAALLLQQLKKEGEGLAAFIREPDIKGLIVASNCGSKEPGVGTFAITAPLH